MPVRPDGRFTDRLVFLHGFTQTHHHWHHVAHHIASSVSTDPSIAFVDLPGHGLAARDPMPIDGAGEPLAQLAGPGTYVGYSMGGRFALAAAVARPDIVERLVLIGATPGIVEAGDREERRALDEDRAAQLERDGVDAFLTTWLAAPMFAGLPEDPAGLRHRRRNTSDGLASSLRGSGTGSQRSLWDALPELETPTLVITGARDVKFTEIGRAMTEQLPHATFRSIPAAGHAAHLEQPAPTVATIARFLTATDHP